MMVENNYQINFYTVKECPICKSKEIEIQEKYDIHKRLEEWTLKCRHCGYEITQDKPF